MSAEIENLKKRIAELEHYKERVEFIESVSCEAVAVFGEDYRCLDITKYTTRLFGYTKEEAIGMLGSDFATPEYFEIARKYAEENDLKPCECRMIRKDGSAFWGMLNASTVYYDNERLRVVTCRDISEEKKLLDRTITLNAEYETIFNNSQVGILLLDENRTIKRANQKVVEIFKYDSLADLIGESIEKFHLSKENYDAFGKYYTSTLLKRIPIKSEYQFRGADGKSIWVSVSGCLVDQQDPPSLAKGVVWVIEDIEQRKEAEAKLQEAYSELEIIFNNAMMGVMLIQGDRIIHRVNQVFANMFEYDSTDELKGVSVREVHLSEEAYEDFGKRFYNALVNQELHAVDYQLKKKDGTPFWVTIAGKAVDSNTPADLSLGVIWTAMDISNRKEAENRLIELSRTDELTGIYNRRYFYELLNIEYEIHKRYNRNFAYISIDIDFFKRVNDTYGHAVGDKALAFFAKTCQSMIRKTDIFGRLGGEEFAIGLLETGLEQALIIAEKIRTKLERILPEMQERIPVMTASMGVILIKNDEDLEEALKRADDLLYKAKESGRDRIMS